MSHVYYPIYSLCLRVMLKRLSGKSRPFKFMEQDSQLIWLRIPTMHQTPFD